MKTFLALACALLLAATGYAQDGLFGPFDTVERFSILFQDSRVETKEPKYYTFALSRNQWPPSKDYYFTLDNVKITDADVEAKMRECYKLAAEAVRNFKTVPEKSPRGIENFMSLSFHGQPAGVSLSFWKGALQENPQLLALQKLLETLIPEKKE